MPALVAAAASAVVGLGMQQLFLRWNQGQELRQALITIAIAVILADQIIAHFGGVPQDDLVARVSTSSSTPHSSRRRRYSLARLFILALAIVVGLALWLWLKRTRTGMVIRAGVDDRQMVSALGVNIQLVFAIAFFVGSALAGFGGVDRRVVRQPAAAGVGRHWLLNSLVVVIIGGMGSLGGAAVGSLLLRRSSSRSRRLPAVRRQLYTHYSIIFTFVLLALVLAFRPLRPLREAGVSRPRARSRPGSRVAASRSCSRGARPAPRSVDYSLDTILTQAFFFGIAAASLIFLAAYGGMVSLAQIALFGIAGFVLGNVVTDRRQRRASISAGTRGSASCSAILSRPRSGSCSARSPAAAPASTS